MKKKQTNNVIKYPKQNHFSIGFVIIGVMFIYMMYHVFTYITAENITVYEVSQGTISSNLEYNALAIREETIYSTDLAGDIIYLAENQSRVGVKTDIYAIDETGDLITSLSATSLSDDIVNQKDILTLQSSISNYVLDYDNSSFSKIYPFKSDLQAQLSQLYNLSALNALDSEVSAAKEAGTFHIYKAPTPGLVVYTVDGMENITVDTFTSEDLYGINQSSSNLKNQENVIAGQPIYKIITSDYWKLVCEIDKRLYETLIDEKYLEIEFLEDERTCWTSCEVQSKNNRYYLILSLDDSMARYASLRYIHIKILDKDIQGLKIPNSSIVKKDFYTIPKAYFYQGDNSSDLGLMVQESSTANRFLSPTIYYETEDYYYIDGEIINNGDLLLKSNSSEKYMVGSDIASLQGVYNVNKGYAVFKQIEVLYQNEDYTIIRTGTDYGIAMYDHIVLQGDEVEENTIIN